MRTSTPSVSLTPGTSSSARFTRGTVVAEEGDAQHGSYPVTVAVLLDELEVDVPVAGDVELLDLAAHPHLARERVDQRLGDRLVQLPDREGGLVHLVAEATAAL